MLWKAMTDDPLKLRKMAFDGIQYDDDWLVMWRGIPVGRILKQNDAPLGKPRWWWGVNFDQRPQGGDGRGVGTDLEDCKRQFKVAWQRVRTGLTAEDIATAIRNDAEADRRAKGQAYRSRKSDGSR
jgi:hypothetical protein